MTRLLRSMLARVRGLVRRDIVSDEIHEELDSHLRQRIEQYEREGLTRDEAAARAKRRVGNLAVHLDRGYDIRGGGMLETFRRELSWSWRGVRERRWRAAFVVVLLGVTLAANLVVFAAADAFVFRVLPYRAPESLVIIQRNSSFGGPSDYMSKGSFLAWREQTDLFAGLHAHERTGSAYVTIDGITEAVGAHAVTPGLFEFLGIVPAWGRPLQGADAAAGALPVAVIGERLARRLFGSPEASLNQSVEAGGTRLTVVGVMPGAFRFPTAREEIWRALDLAGWPDDTGLRHIARLAPAQSVDTARAAVTARVPAINGASTSRRDRSKEGLNVELRRLIDFRRNATASSTFALLAGAAACLLLVACANVASLELAGVARRRRVFAIQSALGASRASLVRVGLLESAFILTAAASLALGLALWGQSLLTEQLTTGMRDALANPIDLDARAFLFMIVVAGATWLLVSLPVTLRASRVSVLAGLRDDSRTMPVSRASVRMRQWLMTGQVALTVMLLVGATLYVRSYAAKVGQPTGLDTSRVMTITVSPTADRRNEHQRIERDLLDRLRVALGVESVARTGGLPPSTQSGASGNLYVDGRDSSPGRPMVSMYHVDPEYFRTLGVSIVRGRAFDASSPPDEVIVDETFARRLLPVSDPLGARFRFGRDGSVSLGGVREFRIVGISRELRADRKTVAGSGEEVFVAYMRLSPTYHPLTFVVKLDTLHRMPAITSLIRAAAGRAIVRVDTVDARYARLEGDQWLSAAVTSGFSALALVVAVAGVYAVMAFLVAGRSREIGIRMALGASAPDVRRLILSTSLRFVLVGAVAGLAGAALTSRWTASQLFGVSALDPATYAGATLLVVAVAMAATWWPARRASLVDPAVTLRAE
jgi:predicted permease